MSERRSVTFGHTDQCRELTDFEYTHSRCQCGCHDMEPAASGDVKTLRAAAQQVMDDWNKIGAMSDGYRALRDALAADELSKSSSSSQAAIRAESGGLDVFDCAQCWAMIHEHHPALRERSGE